MLALKLQDGGSLQGGSATGSADYLSCSVAKKADLPGVIVGQLLGQEELLYGPLLGFISACFSPASTVRTSVEYTDSKPSLPDADHLPANPAQPSSGTPIVPPHLTRSGLADWPSLLRVILGSSTPYKRYETWWPQSTFSFSEALQIASWQKFTAGGRSKGSLSLLSLRTRARAPDTFGSHGTSMPEARQPFYFV